MICFIYYLEERVCIRGYEMFVFRKFDAICFLVTPVLRFGLLLYCWQICHIIRSIVSMARRYEKFFFRIADLTNDNTMLCAIWYHLYNLKNVKNTHGGVLLLIKLQPKKRATLLKVTLLDVCFSRFLNCTNDTKSCNASHYRREVWKLKKKPSLQIFKESLSAVTH